MTIFDPFDASPVTRPAPRRVPSERITTAPGRMPASATCRSHVTWDDRCRKCRQAQAIRADIRANQHRRHIIGLTPGRFGR